MHAIIETNFFPFISSSLFLLLLLPPLLNLLSFSSSMFKLSCIDRRRSKETEQADQLSNQIPSEIQNPINFIRLDMEVMGDLDGRLKYAVWWWWRRRRRRRRRWRRRRRKKEKKEDDDRLQQQDAARRIVRRVHPSCNCAPRSPQFSSSDSFQIPLLLFYLPVFILVNIFNTIHCSINTCYKITGIGNRTGATPAPSAEIFQTDLNWQITRIATRIIASILTTWQYGKCVTHTHTLKMNPADAQWIFFFDADQLMMEGRYRRWNLHQKCWQAPILPESWSIIQMLCIGLWIYLLSIIQMCLVTLLQSIISSR